MVVQERNITVQLPRVLADLVSCGRRVQVSCGTVAEALQDLIEQHPGLRMHLFDDTGALRRRVLCFRNEVEAKSRAKLAQPLSVGDRLTLVSSVASG